MVTSFKCKLRVLRLYSSGKFPLIFLVCLMKTVIDESSEYSSLSVFSIRSQFPFRDDFDGFYLMELQYQQLHRKFYELFPLLIRCDRRHMETENEFRSDILSEAHLPWMFYRSPHFYCRNKANSDSLLMAYYIVTFLASSWLHSSETHSSGTGARALSNLGIEQSHRFSRRSRLSLQAIIASSLVMMDNGGASIKIRPEQYLSE